MGVYEDLINTATDQIAQGGVATAEPQRQPISATASYDQLINQSAKNQAREISLAEPNNDKIDFWENIERGGWSGFFDRATFGVKPLVEASNLHSATQRFKRDRYSDSLQGRKEKVTDEKLITEYLDEQAEVQERGLTIAAKAGNVVFDMLPFMAEFIATGGLASLGKGALRKGTIKLLGKQAKTRAGRIITKTAELAGGAAVRTAVLPQRAALDFVKRRIPDIEKTKEGKILIGEVTETPFKSAYKAIGNQFIEFFSEETGAIIGKVGGKLIPKKVKTALETLRDAWVGGAKGRTALQFVKRIATKTGYNGVLEEFGEERLGDLMRVGFNIDQQEGDSTIERISKALFPGKEQALVELLAFSVPGVAQIGVANIVKRVTGVETAPKSISSPEVQKALDEQTTFSRKDVEELFDVKRSKAEMRQELFDDMTELRAESRTAPQEAAEDVGIEKEGVEGALVPPEQVEGLETDITPVTQAEGVTDVQKEKEAEKLIPPEGVTEAVPSIDDAKEQLLSVDNRAKGKPLSSTSLASSVEERKIFGGSAVPSKVDQSWAQATENGIAFGHLQNAQRISDDVIQTRRPLSDEESGALVHRKGQLIQEYTDLKNQIEKSQDEATIGALSTEASRVEAEFTNIRNAVDISGSARGRALNSQKMEIDEDFRILPVLAQAKTKNQAELSSAERKGFEDAVDKLKAKNTELEAKLKRTTEENASSTVRQGATKKFAQMSTEQKQADFVKVKTKLEGLLKAGCYR